MMARTVSQRLRGLLYLSGLRSRSSQNKRCHIFSLEGFDGLVDAQRMEIKKEAMVCDHPPVLTGPARPAEIISETLGTHPCLTEDATEM
jgi:hypothetical protein